MGKLRELSVERVDGVKDPATKRRWVLAKAEGSETDVEASARALIDSLVKEGADLSDELEARVRELAEELGIKLEPADEPDEPEADADDEGDEPDEPDADADADDEPDVEKRLGTLEAGLAEVISLLKAKPTRKGSQQPKPATETDVAKGEGIFTNIIFQDDD